MRLLTSLSTFWQNVSAAFGIGLSPKMNAQDSNLPKTITPDVASKTARQWSQNGLTTDRLLPLRLAAVLSMLVIFSVGDAWGTDPTITLDYNSFGLTTSYAEKTATVDGFGFTVNQGYKGSGNVIQMNSSKGSGILYNTTAITGLKSVTVNVFSGSKTYTITTGTSEKPTANSQTGTSTGTYNAASGDTYFQLKVSGASYFSSIVITYTTGTSYTLDLSDTGVLRPNNLIHNALRSKYIAHIFSYYIKYFKDHLSHISVL